MKKKRLLYFLVYFIVIFVVFFIFIINVKEHSAITLKPIYNITYIGDDNEACLTFINKKEYSLYDCDSEPTSYFFDNEAECSYKIVGDEIIFKCKYNIYNSKTNKIKVTKWTEKEFSFIYENEEKTFISRN